VSDAIGEAIEKAQLAQPDYNIFTQIESSPAPAVLGDLPLLGVPIAVKDLIDHEGRVTTCGSAFYRRTATSTAPAIRRLEQAGATVIGRTGLHEFAFGFSSENPHFGAVRNPWDRATSPGGSSGGAGAAVAAGIVPIAIGTDTGGSVRVPAALCGCFGLKVTAGRIPIDGVFPLVPSVDTVGPLANSMEGLEMAYRAMAGATEPLAAVQGLRIGIPQPWVDLAPAEERVSLAFARAVDDLAALGHEVHPIELPDVVPSRAIGFAIAAEVVPIHREFREQGLPYGDEVRSRLEESEAVTTSQIAEGKQWQEMIRSRFDDAFALVDLLITPTVPAMVKVIGEDEIDGTNYRKVLSWFTALVNHALVPAIAMPLAGSGTPPVSLQAIAPAGAEARLLAFGKQLEDRGIVGFTIAPGWDARNGPSQVIPGPDRLGSGN
jgi:Asp-tRNA(Asn)/Glu-tRNA(Gln) amidotransferase A subunit family amidase